LSPRTPVALAISGFDPSGGAGILADLRAFRAAGAWGCGAVAVLTVQSTAGLSTVRSLQTSFVLAQVRELLQHERIGAIKTGALGSASNVTGLVRLLEPFVSRIPLVVDPVIAATKARGNAVLTDSRAVRRMNDLLGIATVVTPNAHEAAALLRVPVRTLGQAADAACALVANGARAAVVTGGHLAVSEATDVLAIGKRVLYLSAPRQRCGPLHGAGCSFAALVAGRLAAHRAPLADTAIVEAVRWAKARLGRAIASATRIGDGLLVLPL
jgi:hydroxymethylpyrimidine/phosphomethylpyrimidine kinase